MEKVLTQALKGELRRKIRGVISVHIVEDMLIVDIRRNGSAPWRYTIKNIAVQLSVGLSSRIIADVITKQYKNYILKTYFR
nr:MAG TPA: hypothetical protein [Caudoviricetes sp.]